LRCAVQRGGVTGEQSLTRGEVCSGPNMERPCEGSKARLALDPVGPCSPDGAIWSQYLLGKASRSLSLCTTTPGNPFRTPVRELGKSVVQRLIVANCRFFAVPTVDRHGDSLGLPPGGIHIRCPKCDGRRGAVIAKVIVTRKSPYGEWKYIRYTHRSRLADGRLKRKYCYAPITSETN
jgi:hypothetical protein